MKKWSLAIAMVLCAPMTVYALEVGGQSIDLEVVDAVQIGGGVAALAGAVRLLQARMAKQSDQIAGLREEMAAMTSAIKAANREKENYEKIVRHEFTEIKDEIKSLETQIAQVAISHAGVQATIEVLRSQAPRRGPMPRAGGAHADADID